MSRIMTTIMWHGSSASETRARCIVYPNFNVTVKTFEDLDEFNKATLNNLVCVLHAMQCIGLVEFPMMY